MNYVEKLAEMLGIEVGVPFNINEHNNRYRFDADGTFSWECDGECFFWSKDLVLTGHFLQRMLTVKWKPIRGEQYYMIDPKEIDGYLEARWKGYDFEKRLYDRGLVFRTEEEVIAKTKEYGWIK